MQDEPVTHRTDRPGAGRPGNDRPEPGEGRTDRPEAGERGTVPPAATPGVIPPAPTAAETARGLSVLVLGGVALVVCLLVLGALAEEVHDQEALFLDSVANPFMHAFASPTLDAVMGVFTFLGSAPAVPVLLALAVAALLVLRDPRHALFLAVAIGGSFAINQGLKFVFHRPRPVLAWSHVIPEYSFPSGHAQNGIVFYVALALIAWALLGRRAGLVATAGAVVLALLIGASRIYFGYHYLSDVVGGYAAGLAWLLIVGLAFDAAPMLERWRSWRDARQARHPRSPRRRAGRV